MKPHLIVGGDSLIGRAVAQRLRQCGEPLLATSRRPGASLPLDLGRIAHQWHAPPEVGSVLFCAGVTDVMACEAAPEITQKINVDATAIILKALAKQGRPYVLYLSSSLVFDGRQPRIRADAPYSPTVMYGRQKVAGERLTLDSGLPAGILRLSKVVDGPLGVVRQWREMAEHGQPIRPFHDYPLSPVPLARVVDIIVRLLTSQSPGIWQYSAEDQLSYADLAGYWSEQRSEPIEVVSRSIAEVPGYSGLKRPYATLDTTAVRGRLGIQPVTSREQLKTLLGLED